MNSLIPYRPRRKRTQSKKPPLYRIGVVRTRVLPATRLRSWSVDRHLNAIRVEVAHA
jgi:hypothetical protein